MCLTYPQQDLVAFFVSFQLAHICKLSLEQFVVFIFLRNTICFALLCFALLCFALLRFASRELQLLISQSDDQVYYYLSCSAILYFADMCLILRSCALVKFPPLSACSYVHLVTNLAA